MASKSRNRQQFFLFLLAGAAGAGVNFISRIYLNIFFSFENSVLISCLFGMGTAFFISKNFVFSKSSNTLFKSAAIYCGINAISILQTWAVSMMTFRLIYNVPHLKLYCYEISHLLGLAVPVFTSYYGNKYLTFKKN